MRSRSRSIVARFLVARGRPADALKAVLPDVREGNYEAADALVSVLSSMNVSSRPGEFRSVHSIDGEWYYAMGPRDQSHVEDMVRSVLDLQKRVTHEREEGNPPSTQLLLAFEKLYAEAVWLQGKMRDEGDGFSHGGFTIILMDKVSKAEMTDCLGALDEAASAVRSKFPEVLYGKVYLTKSIRGHSTYASYIPDHDTIQLTPKAKNTIGTVHAIAHELGHRYESRFWSDKRQRELFRTLSTDTLYEQVTFDRALRAKMADEFLDLATQQRSGRRAPGSDLLTAWSGKIVSEKLERIRPIIQRYIQGDDTLRDVLWEEYALPASPDVTLSTKKVVRGPLAVTEYGKKSWRENFAEAFAHYVLGKSLPPEIATLMGDLR